MNEDVDGLTQNEIAEEIAHLRQLQKTGDITPSQGDRLVRLEWASKRCSPWSLY